MARTLSVIFTLPAVLLGVGFIFHTSFEPSVFGKYTWGYFIFLLVWWLVVTPLAFLFFRFVFNTQELKLKTRTLYLRPSQKIVILGAIGIALWLVIDRRIEKEMAKRSTATADSTHAFLQNTPRHNDKFHINRWGFRGDDIEKKKPANTTRIFVFGGSTVFCGRLNYEDVHTAQLQKKLREAYPDRNIEVQNLGADWHTSAHSLIKLMLYAQEFEPDIVIIYHGINDLMRSLTPETFTVGAFRPDYGHYYGAIANRINPKNRWKLINMQMGFWFSDFRFDRVYTPGPYGDGTHGSKMMFFPKAEAVEWNDWPSLDPFDRNLREFVTMTRNKGAKVLICTQPSMYQADAPEDLQQRWWFAPSHQVDDKMPNVASMAKAMKGSNDRIRQIATDLKVDFVDLTKAVPQTAEAMHDDVHYTAEGCMAIALSWVEFFKGSGWIESKNP